MQVSGQLHATAASLALNEPLHARNTGFGSPQSLPECSEEVTLPSPFRESNPDYFGRTARSQVCIPNRLNKRPLVSL
jgi:hypothetical protein